MISYQGKIGALVAFPVLAQLLAAVDIAGLQAELAGLISLSVSYTVPSVEGLVAFLAQITAALPAFVPPTVDLKADILAKIGLLEAKITLLLTLTGLVTSGSLRVYEYDGDAGSFGGELSATLAGPDGDGGVPAASTTFAVVLLAEAGGPDETLLKALRAGV